MTTIEENNMLDRPIEFIAAENSTGNIATKELYGSSRNRNSFGSDFEILTVDNYYDNIISGKVKDKKTGKVYYANLTEECDAENVYISKFWGFYNLYEFTEFQYDALKNIQSRRRDYWKRKINDQNIAESFRRELDGFFAAIKPSLYAFSVFGWNTDSIDELWEDACLEYMDIDFNTNGAFEVARKQAKNMIKIPNNKKIIGPNNTEIRTKKEFFNMVRTFRKDLLDKNQIEIS